MYLFLTEYCTRKKENKNVLNLDIDLYGKEDKERCEYNKIILSLTAHR